MYFEGYTIYEAYAQVEALIKVLPHSHFEIVSLRNSDLYLVVHRLFK